jgi:hypothetical protein
MKDIDDELTSHAMRLAQTSLEEDWKGEDYSNKWISVEYRIPELGERVIVFCESQGAQLCYLGHENEWHITYNMTKAYLNITHWMPLPTPPQTKN